jgi:hypothetical protein
VPSQKAHSPRPRPPPLPRSSTRPPSRLETLDTWIIVVRTTYCSWGNSQRTLSSRALGFGHLPLSVTNKIQLSSYAPTRGWCRPWRRPEQPTGLWPGQSTGKWAIPQTLLAASRSQQGQALQVDSLVARLSVGGRKRCHSTMAGPRAGWGSRRSWGEGRSPGCLILAGVDPGHVRSAHTAQREKKENHKTAPSATSIKAQTMIPLEHTLLLWRVQEATRL